jgi:hypothetical protein
MDNKFIAPGSQTSNAWCCNCARERHAWHDFDRFACRHCVKRDKSRPLKTVATPTQQKLRCTSTLPLVGRNSAAVAETVAEVIPAVRQLDAGSGERGVVQRGERVPKAAVDAALADYITQFAAGALEFAEGNSSGTSTKGHAAVSDVDVGALRSAAGAQVGVNQGAETKACYGDRGEAPEGKGCTTGCCCS